MKQERNSLRELALFAGAGGGILGGTLLGWRTICAVEIDAFCRDVLLTRQRDGVLPRFPIWGDIRTFDGKLWRGHVDIISGGFPCQDISAAGKGEGLAGERSGLWFEMLRIIEEVQPRFIFAENSPYLRVRGLGTIIEGLTNLGYDCKWCVLGAWHVRAPHRRNRLWLLAHNSSERLDVRKGKCENTQQELQAIERDLSGGGGQEVTNTHCNALRQQSRRGRGESGQKETVTGGPDWWCVDSFSGVADGLANRMDRVKATGNGQVPAVAALAWEILSKWD